MPGQAIALALAGGAVGAVLAHGARLTGETVQYEPRFNLRIPNKLLFRSAGVTVRR